MRIGDKPTPSLSLQDMEDLRVRLLTVGKARISNVTKPLLERLFFDYEMCRAERDLLRREMASVATGAESLLRRLYAEFDPRAYAKASTVDLLREVQNLLEPQP